MVAYWIHNTDVSGSNPVARSSHHVIPVSGEFTPDCPMSTQLGHPSSSRYKCEVALPPTNDTSLGSLGVKTWNLQCKVVAGREFLKCVLCLKSSSVLMLDKFGFVIDSVAVQ